MAGPYDTVQDQFTAANGYAQQAAGNATQFISALTTFVGSLQMPDLEADIEPPELPDKPDSVELSDLDVEGDVPEDTPPELADETLEAFSAGAVPGAPSLDSVSISSPAIFSPPTEPSLREITAPDKPSSWTAPNPPALLSINVRPFEGVDSHGDWLAKLNDAPDDLVLAAPTAFAPPQLNKYDSALLQDMTSLLRLRLRGGTGLSEEVEQALWDRDRSRITAAAEASITEAVRDAEARGFMLPTGAMNLRLQEAQKTALAKSAEATHEIAFKQADLEQANAKHAIEQGLALESQLIQYVNNIEQRTFDAAKFLASNAVEIYNAQVNKYRTLLEQYKSFADIYRTLIESERMKVEVYRADVEAERAKSDINRALIEEMKIQIDVRNAHIALYRAEVEAAQVLVSSEKLRVESFGERVRAYAAQMNAITSQVEIAKARVQANESRAAVYRAQVEGYSAGVQARAMEAKAKADIYDAKTRAYASKVQAYSAKIGAYAEKVRASVAVKQLSAEADKLKIQQYTAEATTQAEFFKASVESYRASTSIADFRAKMAADNYMAIKSMIADASKVGAQVNAQLAASAYGTLHAQAQISGSASTVGNYSYSGDTSDSKSAPDYVS